jgi:predicted nucleotidyltransferase
MKKKPDNWQILLTKHKNHNMTIEFLRENGLIVFECISGSHAYGTNHANSDIDKRGVFICPQDNIYGFEYVEQVNDATNDVTFYEIGRFLELLMNNNPNIIEILFTPKENIIYSHPLFDVIREKRHKFITKMCKNTFAGYASTQIKKARGLNKKIVNPVDKERKSILDFCHVIADYNTIPRIKWLELRGYTQEKCGLVNIPHAKDIYALFYDQYATKEGSRIGYRGIANVENTSNEVRLSSIPKGEKSMATMIYNKEGYTKYCKDYKEYWEWVEKRNVDRFETNAAHGKNYDSKNMMHCVRLLRMALEIAKTGNVIVKRPDAEELMEIRLGNRDYDDLLAEAENTIKEMDTVYENSPLPDNIDSSFVNKLLINTRIFFYELHVQETQKC